MTEKAISPRKLINEREEEWIRLSTDCVKGNEKGDESKSGP